MNFIKWFIKKGYKEYGIHLSISSFVLYVVLTNLTSIFLSIDTIFGYITILISFSIGFICLIMLILHIIDSYLGEK